MPPRDTDLALPSGRVRVRVRGDHGPLVVCIPGISANLVALDPIGEALAAAGFRAVTPDLRGRGLSDVTGPGTYGWPAHAEDVAAIASALGAERFDVVGWSMGAHVGMQLAATAPERCRRLVLIDACGPVGEEALALIERGVERLGAVYPTLPGYLEMVRGLGMVRPWSAGWDRYYEYEMEPVEGGWRARTSRAAVQEDLAWGRAHDGRDLWPRLRAPVLLLRAARPLLPDGGDIVETRVRDEFLAAVSGARALEIDANHYGIVAHPATARAAVGFLREEDR
jgi:pimeloyl-ACP methyl ester carboxylesterase